MFSGCRGLTSITIPDSVTDIGGFAFRGCASLTSITIPDSVTSIGESAFEDCSELTSITIPFVGEKADGSGETHFGYIFGADSDSYNDDYVPDSLKSVVIIGVTSIGYDAFYNCSGLTSVTIGNGVTSIGDYAFRNCSGLTSVTIGSGVTSIGDDAFYNCSGLMSVTIGNGVTSIGDDAFSGCSGLTSIVVEAGNAVYHSVGNCLIATESKTLIVGCKGSLIPTDGSVTSIGERAFAGCDDLTSITIPDSITSIGDNAFYNCNGLIIYCEAESKPSGWNSSWNGTCPVVWNCNNNEVAADGAIYIMIDNMRYALKDGEATVARQLSTTGGDIVIPNTITYNENNYLVTGIGSSAFSGCSGLTSITIPDSVTSIGKSAFSGCSGLTSVIIGNGVTSIGSSAFYGCSGLTSVTIPDSVTSIGDSAFEGCTALNKLFIPKSVKQIGAFLCTRSSVTTIYCEADKKPSGWDRYWNISSYFSYNRLPDGSIVVNEGKYYSVVWSSSRS